MNTSLKTTSAVSMAVDILGHSISCLREAINKNRVCDVTLRVREVSDEVYSNLGPRSM